MFSFFISCSDTFLLSWQFSLYVLFSISFEIDCIQYVAYTQMSLLFRGAIFFFFFFFFLGGGGGGGGGGVIPKGSPGTPAPSLSGSTTAINF